MFGLRYIKFDPSRYVLRYSGGQVQQQGAGLSFWYFAPVTTLVAVPLESTDAPFIFEEVTADFQQITIQGQVTYRISSPEKTAGLLNFTLDSRGDRYVTRDLEKLQQRVINAVKVLTQAQLRTLPLKAALIAGADLVAHLRAGLGDDAEIQSLGLEVLGLSILAIKPNPETARALEAEVRERLMKEADDAIYLRRNAAVEQERSIKENELRTEQVVQDKRHQLETRQTEHRIAEEGRRREFVTLSAENARTEADARAYGLAAVVKAFGESDARIIQALVQSGLSPDRLVAGAIQELASKADKIGELNLSPDLLRELLSRKPAGGKS